MRSEFILIKQSSKSRLLLEKVTSFVLDGEMDNPMLSKYKQIEETLS